MPKIKHNFVQGKMNKDLDERLVPNGQYKDALNIQVSTSEDSEIGTIQNILGNSLVPGQDFIHDNATCVGSIADEKNDKLYWFISNGTGPELSPDPYFQTGDHGGSGGVWQRAASMTTTFDSNGVTIVTDGSTGGSYPTFTLRTVNSIELVDKQLYKVEVKFFNIDEGTGANNMTWWVGGSSGSGGDNSYRPTNAHYGGVHPDATNGTHVAYFRMDKSQNKAGGVGSGTTNMHFRFEMTEGNSVVKTMGIEYASIKRVGSSVIVEYDTVKNLVTPVFVDEDNTTLDFRSDSLITGINIIDDMLFWTDGYSEPKKINIPRSIQGTDTRGVENTQLINHTQTSASDGMVGKAREEHVTVIKKPPLNSLKLDLDLISERDPSKTWTGIMSIGANMTNSTSIIGSSQGIVSNFSSLSIGDTFKTFITSDIDNNQVFTLNWKPGDTVVIKQFDTLGSAPTIPIQDYQIKGVITNWEFNQFENGVTEYIGPNLLNGSFTNGSGNTTNDWIHSGTTWKWDSTHKNLESLQGHHASFAMLLPNIQEGQTWRLSYNVGAPNDGTTPLEGRLWVSMHISDTQIQHVAGRALFGDEQATTGYKEHLFTIDSSDPAFVPNYAWGSGLTNRLIFHTKDYTPSGGTQEWFNGTIDNVKLELVDTTQAQVEIKINSILGDKPEVLTGTNLALAVDLYDDGNSLFKFKFPRFSYRYKYLDGEYSVFAPFSNVAFSAGVFNYDPSQAYNLGMQNNVKSIILSGFENNLPKDVEDIDILYKEEVSPNIYIVDTISASQVDQPYIITQESIQNGVLPSNQLLRPWDNVPKKALAQEISGNRIIYGNYTQNYDLVDSNNNKYFIDINTDLISKENTQSKGLPSIKSLRSYQVGVVYADEYGRQTPILTSDDSANYIPKEQSGTLNSFQVRIASEGTPVNMKYFKFFIKDNSGEYYNLVMDRYYKAGVDTVWLSFPSSERNKIDIDDFIMLKKGMASSTAVISNTPTKYKILDIKNEAPDSIAVTEMLLLSLSHDTSVNLNLFNDSNNLPIANRKVFEINFANMQYNALANIEEAFLSRDISSEWVVELTHNDIGRTTRKHKIVGVKLEATDSVHFTLEKSWSASDDGINEFTDDPSGSNPTKIIDGTIFNIYKTEPSRSNLFKGRFFVKIKSDSMNVVQPALTTTNTQWITTASRSLYSLVTSSAGTNTLWFPQRDMNMPIVSVGDGSNIGNPSEDNGFFHGIATRGDSVSLAGNVARGANTLDKTWAGWWASMIRTGRFYGTLNGRKRMNIPTITPQTSTVPTVSHELDDNRHPNIFLDYDAYFRGLQVFTGDASLSTRVTDDFDYHNTHSSGTSFEDVWFVDSGAAPGIHPYTTGSGNTQQWGTNITLHGQNVPPAGVNGNILEIGFGGIQPVEWPKTTTYTPTQAGFYEDSSFYDLRDSNTNYSSREADFINKITAGSQFRFKEDPTNTIYTIQNVEIFHRVRYETLLRQHLGELNDDINYGSLGRNTMFKYQILSLNGNTGSPSAILNDIGHIWDDPNVGHIGEYPDWDGRVAPMINVTGTQFALIHTHGSASSDSDYSHPNPYGADADSYNQGIHGGYSWNSFSTDDAHSGIFPTGAGSVTHTHWANIGQFNISQVGLAGQTAVGGMDQFGHLPRVLESLFPEIGATGTVSTTIFGQGNAASWANYSFPTTGSATLAGPLNLSANPGVSAHGSIYSQSGDPVFYKPTTFFRASNFTKNFRLTLDKSLTWDPITWQGYSKIPGAKEVQLTASSDGRSSAPYNYIDVSSLIDSTGGATDGNVLTVGMVLYKYASTSINNDELAIVSKITDLGGSYRLHFKKYGGGPAFASADSSGNIPHINSSNALYFAQFPMNALSTNAAKNLNWWRDGKGFNSAQAGTDAVGYTIEFIESVSTYFTDDETLPPNPAVWETEPKEQTTDIDIYYEASSFYPTKLTYEIIDGSIIHSGIPSHITITSFDDDGGLIELSEKVNIDGALLGYLTPITGTITSNYEADHFINIGDRLKIGLKNGGYAQVEVTNVGGLDSAGKTKYFQVNTDLHNAEFELDWFNCFAFGNGVESNRISDVFNKQFITPGVKVSTVFDRYQEEERKYGLIYSGIYNSNSGINNLNQFIQAEKITKDVNPSYGSIQKLHSRDTDLVTLCEDKVLRILANKDAVFNADGNPQLVATQNVLGQTIPFVGEYGISKNPESFVSEAYRSYFTDKQRGTVMRLSRDGLTPISDHGMSNWFKDNLSNSQTNLLGNPFTPTSIQNLMIPGYNHGVRAPIYEEDIITLGSINEAAWETGDYSHNNFGKFPYLLKENILEVGKKYRLQFDVVEVGGGAEWMVRESDGEPPSVHINKAYGSHWSGVSIPGSRETGHISVEWVSETTNLFLCITQVNPVEGYFDGSNTQTTTVQEYIGSLKGDTNCVSVVNGGDASGCTISNWDWFYGGVTKIKNLILEEVKDETKLIGSWDDKKNEYNLTIHSNDPKTVSFKENVTGWVSFKSFIPENAISCANDYYTFKDGKIWQHHIEGSGRNTFYGIKYPSNFTVLLNDFPNIVKSFHTIDYEGSQANITGIKTITAEKIEPTHHSHAWATGVNSGKYIWDFDMDTMMDLLGIDSWEVGNPGSYDIKMKQYRNNILVAHNDMRAINNSNGVHMINLASQKGGDFQIGDIITTEDQEKSVSALDSMPKTGWYTSNITTDMQEGTIPEFVNKENKWFNYIKGKKLTSEIEGGSKLNSLTDFGVFNIQGVGVAYSVGNDRIYFMDREYVNTSLQLGDTLYFVPASKKGVGNSLSPVWNFSKWNEGWIKHNPALAVLQGGSGHVKILSDSANVTSSTPVVYSNYFSLEDGKQYRLEMNVKEYDNGGDTGSADFIKIYIEGGVSGVGDRQILTNAVTGHEGVYHETTVGKHFLDFTYDASINNDENDVRIQIELRNGHVTTKYVTIRSITLKELNIGDSFGFDRVNSSDIQRIGEVTMITSSNTSDTNSIQVDNTSGAMPSPLDYIMFAKNQVINTSGLLGYYASVKFENNSQEKIELFSVNSEITESSK